MDFKNFKIVVFTPLPHCDKIRKAIGDAGAGHIGNYSHTSFSSKGIGRFMPNDSANPFIGKSGKIEEVEEERIEFICPKEMAKDIVALIRKVHPYEEPAIDIIPLWLEKDLENL
jgi:hypothetical protein